ncbi:MAG: DUF805 domain-containing protein [Alphaproteobacteria bacterium]|jgi:uncharacterized membrane protein YhaH (DUF805 family)|nr:DUF805 domain-containing protein [Alphaproteobacteria bacterium]
MGHLLFSLKGRVSRKTYWIFALVCAVAYVMALSIDGAMMGEEEDGIPLGTLVLSLAVFWPSIVIQVKRWHDRDKAGWWIFIALVPLLGPVWALVENGFLPGTTGDNRFGPPPES